MNCVAENLGKHDSCSQSQRSKKNLFLTDAEDYDLRRCCEVFIECKIVGEESNKTQQTEMSVETMKEYEEKTHLLQARSLNDMVDDVVWVSVLNPTLENRKITKMWNSICGKY